jgi:hypothetical protein
VVNSGSFGMMNRWSNCEGGSEGAAKEGRSESTPRLVLVSKILLSYSNGSRLKFRSWYVSNRPGYVT